MAYQYEDRLYANSLVRSTSENVFIETGETKEIKEVYDKAKAFDEVIKKVETEFVSEDLADSIRILVNDYEYDMEEK